MRLNCTIDGTQYSLNVNADKPLSKILEENIESFAINSHCKGATCGNCMVIINNSYMLSCLVPAFKLSGATIMTYEGFSKTRFCHDIEKAYTELEIKPCTQCYASKTLLISSIVEKAENIIQNANSVSYVRVRQKNFYDISSLISSELTVNCCNCMEIRQIEKIIKLVCQYRSKRRGIPK